MDTKETKKQYLQECQIRARHRGDTVINVLHAAVGIAFGASVVLLILMYLQMNQEQKKQNEQEQILHSHK